MNWLRKSKKEPDNEWTKKTFGVFECARIEAFTEMPGQKQGDIIYIPITIGEGRCAIVKSRNKIGTQSAYRTAVEIVRRITTGEWTRGWVMGTYEILTLGFDDKENDAGSDAPSRGTITYGDTETGKGQI